MKKLLFSFLFFLSTSQAEKFFSKTDTIVGFLRVKCAKSTGRFWKLGWLTEAKRTHWRWLFHTQWKGFSFSTPLPVSQSYRQFGRSSESFFLLLWIILWELSLRTASAGWLSGWAPWWPLDCKLLRWENQVGGDLREHSGELRLQHRGGTVSHVTVAKLALVCWVTGAAVVMWAALRCTGNGGLQHEASCQRSATHHVWQWFFRFLFITFKANQSQSPLNNLFVYSLTG